MRFCSQCGQSLRALQKEFCGSRCRQAAEREALRSEFIRAYGGKCQCPGGCDVRIAQFLSLDHTDGGGDKHRKKTGTRGWRMYKLLREQGWPKLKYRLLCYNCNMSRAFHGKCPHESPGFRG